MVIKWIECLKAICFAETNWLDLIQTIFSFITVIITIIGLYAIWRQIKQSSKQLKKSHQMEIYSKNFEINRIFIENPKLRPYFYENKSFLNK